MPSRFRASIGAASLNIPVSRADEVGEGGGYLREAALCASLPPPLARPGNKVSLDSKHTEPTTTPVFQRCQKADAPLGGCPILGAPSLPTSYRPSNDVNTLERSASRLQVDPARRAPMWHPHEASRSTVRPKHMALGRTRSPRSPWHNRLAPLRRLGCRATLRRRWSTCNASPSLS